MNRAELTAVFNQGFRCGSNDRAAAGLVLSRTETPPPPAHIPLPPPQLTSELMQRAWREGYSMGYTMGGSDAELAAARSVLNGGAYQADVLESLSDPRGRIVRVTKAR